MTPQQALALLKEGNRRFFENRLARRNFSGQVRETGDGQYPFAVVLGCVDSRVPPEIIFDLGIGDIFCARIAGNIVNPEVLGSLEFAVKVAGAKLILVLGHTKCGAIMGAAGGMAFGNLGAVLAKLKPAVEAVRETAGPRAPEDDGFIRQVVEKNVELALEAIREGSPVLRDMLAGGVVALAGAVYDIDSGQVTFL